MPYRTPNGPIYDSGEFRPILERAQALADWKGFGARRRASRRSGKLRGIGIGCFLEVAGGILDETVDLRFEADGKVALRTGAQAMGQGHLSTFVPLLARRLGVDPQAVRLVEGDSDEVPAGTPSVASRSIMMAGSATTIACDQAIEKGRRGAAHVLEADASDIEFADGVFRVIGTDRAIPILDLAARMRDPGMPEELAGGLDTLGKFVSPQMSFPNGCHICEVEIDPETGVVDVVAYTAVDDVGNVLQRADRAGADPRRRSARHRAGARRAGGLWRRRPAADRLVHGLPDAARRRSAADDGAPPCRSLHHQPDRRQGRGRIRRGGLAALRGQRRARRPGGSRGLASRSADDTGAGMVGASTGRIARSVEMVTLPGELPYECTTAAPVPVTHLDYGFWWSGVRISSGAPPVLICEPDFAGGLSGEDRTFQHLLAASDANVVVVDLNGVNK